MSNSTFRYIWDRLPDPGKSDHSLISIVAEYNAWKHFCFNSKHLTQRSSVFEEWLGTELCRNLRDAWCGNCPPGEKEQRLSEAGKAMDAQIRHAMNAPIVLVFDCTGINGGKQGERWRLPLQNGIRMFAKRLKKHAVLVTCFPPDAVSSALIPAHRSLMEIRNVVETYADFRDGELRLPKPVKQVPKKMDGKKTIQTNFRFHRPQTWGFDGDNPGSRWSLPIHYPAAGSGFRLVPRANMQWNATE